ncbi:MAG: DUF2828 family protein [Lachnospiraceae bacterium]|nr:DUF2828 family protein [Lachnospiraceae bacterium]
MINAIKRESNKTYTENGAVTNVSTFSDCLDLFATVGALRKASEQEILDRFIRAYTEDSDTAMKILFFARDIRGGLGERRVFRTVMTYLAAHEPTSVKKNIEYFGEYGRFDDLLSLMGTPCEKDMLAYIAKQFTVDMEALNAGESVSLLAKWLPSVNASNADAVAMAKKIARSMKMTDRDYRKAVVELRAKIRIIENNLREKDYSFDYSKQPSKAMFKYRAAFLRNDTERYKSFINKVSVGEAKLHAGTIMPYELVDPYLEKHWGHEFMRGITEDEKKILNATWESLPDFGGDENALAVIDTSGSMYWTTRPTPASVALSLGLYFAERNKGLFHNHFIEFSHNARLIEIKGETFADRLRYVTSFCEVADTNIEAVFDLILRAAVKNHIPQSEMPATLYLISDMEFNSCVRNAGATNFENAKKKYEAHGYKLPNVVFWNVQSRNRQQPVTMNEQGVALVSGCTPRLFSMVASGNIDPYSFMMEVVGNERYEKIVA